MTMPDERTRALVGGFELIQLVLSDPTASAELKQHARWVKRHFPEPREVRAEAQRQMIIDPALQSFMGAWLAPFD